jgi:hypothetical protein
MARDRRERRARAHAMPRKQRAQCGEITHRRDGPRHAAHRHSGTARFAKAFRGPASMRQSAPSPKLAAGVITPDVPAWQTMIRVAQTPAFSAAVMLGLALTWLGTEAPSVVTWLDGGAPTHLHSAHSPPRPAHRETPRSPVPTMPAFGEATPRSGSLPTTGDRPPVREDIDPKVFAKLEEVLAELSHDARPPQPPPRSKPLPDSTKSQPSTAAKPEQKLDAPLPNTAPTDPAGAPKIQQPIGAGPGPATRKSRPADGENYRRQR